MFKKVVSFILSVLILVLPVLQFGPTVFAISTVWDGSIADSFESGTGAWGDPYIIKTAEQLAYLASSVNNGNSYAGEYIRLDADILLNDTTNWESWGTYNEQGNLIAPVNSWMPIGSGNGNGFAGCFDGNDHIVSGMYVYGDNIYAGLFGTTVSIRYNYNNSISNITIEKSLVQSYVFSLSDKPVTGGIVGRADDNTNISNCRNSGNVMGSGYYTGGVVGYARNSFVFNCYNTGTVTGEGDTGGVVGDSSGSTVEDCYNTGAVTGEDDAGGVAGDVYSSFITDCYNTGTVTGKRGAGGVLGRVDESTINHCYNINTVTGGNGDDYSRAGGVAGTISSSTVTLCYNTGTVMCEAYYAGGVFGINGDSSTVSDCYNTGVVACDNKNYHEYVGGVAGYIQGKVSNCYSIGVVTSGDSNNYSRIGGFSGGKEADGSISSCYYLYGCVESGNEYGTPYTDEQLRDSSLYDNWNFNKTWEIGYNTEYPYPTLRYFGSKEYYYRVRFFDGENCLFDQLINAGEYIEIFSPEDKKDLDFVCWRYERYYSAYVDTESEYNEFWVYDDIDFKAIWTTRNTSDNVWDGSVDTDWEGEGTEESPYLISSAAELAGLAQRVNWGSQMHSKYFRQTVDIVLNDGGDRFCEDIAGKNYWVPIGAYSNYSFLGNYDGGGHTVSGIYIWGWYKYAGLFGRVYRGNGRISNLGIIDSFVYNYDSDSYTYTGGVAGEGNVTNCYNTGYVRGGDGSSSYIGGVVGTGDAVNCYNTGNVIGDAGYVGGVVGSGNATNCYNTGDVITDGNYYTGGVVGHGNAYFCYNTGNITSNGYSSDVGGVVGSSYGTITECYNTGNITGNDTTGGVVGYISSGSLIYCYNEGTVIGNRRVSGGVAGQVGSRCQISNCYNTGNVSGNGYDIGGIAGRVSENGSVSDSYNTGVIRNDYCYYNTSVGVGGVIGRLEGTVSNCYNIGTVIVGDDYDFYCDCGGIIGIFTTKSKINNCYYLSGCVEKENNYGTSLSEEKMKKADSFENWNFNKNWEIGFYTEYNYPTLRFFGSKNYYYRVRFFDGETCLSDDLVRVGESIFFSKLTDKDTLDFGYWRSDETRYYSGDALIPTDDIDFKAIWTTRNTSANVWDGSVDTDWEGEGTKESPYLISSAAELAGLSQQVNSGFDNSNEKYYKQKYFKQTVDIVLNDGGNRFSDDIAGKNDWIPIGYGDYSLYGNYDGDGHTVSGMYIRGSYNYAGLFGRVYSEDGISNLGVIDSYVYNTGAAGGVAGTVYGEYVYDENDGDFHKYGGIVSNCYNTGAVTGSSVGGVVCYGSADNCYNSGTVTGSGTIGGVVGSVGDDGVVVNCRNTGTIIGELSTSSSSYTGGVVGYANGIYNNNSKISNCCNIGLIISGCYDTGGVVGYASNSIVTDCYNTGAVTGKSSSGGIVGVLWYTTVSNCYNTGVIKDDNGNYSNYTGGIAGRINDGTINECYNTGTVISSGGYNSYNYSHVGGIAGYFSVGTINESYNTGTVKCDDDYRFRYIYVGGLAGYNGYGTIYNCYNTGEVSGKQSNTSIIGGVTGGLNEGTVKNCYNIGTVPSYFRSYGIVGELEGDGTVDNCYFLYGCASGENGYGTVLTDEQMKTADSFVGFDFEGCWDIGVARGYDYPTLKNAKHKIYFNITFLDRDGTVLKKQAVEIGESAEPPALEGYGDNSYYYILDHWDGSYNNVTEDRTVTAVYKQVEIIKFNDVSVPFTVEYGFSNEELRVQLESYFSRKLCTTTNGYKMMCEVVWNEENLDAYNPQQAGEYIINGVLKITDPDYSQFADYYDMADGATVKVTVTVLPENEQAVHFEENDLKYDILEDNQSVSITEYSGNATEVIIPENIDGYNVTAISENAFSGNQTITAITIPSSIKTVGNNAFDGCSALVQVTFEDGVEEIGEKAFYNTDLVSVTLPDSITTIGAKAFGYYGDDSLIEGFAIYCSADSVAKVYAAENGIVCNAIEETVDTDTGISVVAEENVTLVVAQVEEGTYYETAQQIVQENDNISLFEIKIVDEQSKEVQPGNTLKISVPVPEGFDAETCEVYRINTDGTFKAMNAKLIDGKLVFMTPHLSYYAIVEVKHIHIPDTPVKENEVPATCVTDGGYDEVIYCLECGDIVSSEHKTIPFTGHKYKSDITNPTCTENGYTTYTCEVCGDSYVDDYTEPSGHNYGDFTSDADSHWHECPDCGDKADIESHIYDNDCDGVCNVCGYVREVSHSYSEAFVSNGFMHWHVCTVCGDKKDIADHTDSNNDGICDICNGTIKAATPGDITGDGKIDSKDLTRLKKYLSGTDVEYSRIGADCTGDGKIDAKDLTRLKKYLAGQDVQLGE